MLYNSAVFSKNTVFSCGLQVLPVCPGLRKLDLSWNELGPAGAVCPPGLKLKIPALGVLYERVS